MNRNELGEKESQEAPGRRKRTRGGAHRRALRGPETEGRPCDWSTEVKENTAEQKAGHTSRSRGLYEECCPHSKSHIKPLTCFKQRYDRQVCLSKDHAEYINLFIKKNFF